MINSENEIREHLKALTPKDIADSTYLFGVDFENEPIESILDSIISLYDETKQLNKIIESDFGKNNEEKILLPQSRETQSIVIENYSRKYDALEKILSNPYVADEVAKRIKEQRNKKEK